MKEAKDTKGHVAYDSNHMKCPEKANPWRQKVDSWLPGARRDGEIAGDNQGCGVPFCGDESVLAKNGDGCMTL